MPTQKPIKKRPAAAAKKDTGARRLTTALILLVCIVVLVIATLVLDNLYRRHVTSPGSSTASDSGGSFSITSLSVEGNQRYTEADILAASGLKLGQSVWAVSLSQAKDNILSLCPYVDRVSIDSTSFGAYRITVTETPVLGALVDRGEWVLVGTNGNALERLPIQSDTPPRMIYLKGAKYSGEGLGKPAMDERSTAIVKTLADALKRAELTGIAEIDLSDRSDIRLNWNQQIIIRLGNDGNLAYEVSLAAEILPRVLKNHGDQARGILDLSSYTSDTAPDQVVFTPNELLSSQPAA